MVLLQCDNLNCSYWNGKENIEFNGFSQYEATEEEAVYLLKCAGVWKAEAEVGVIIAGAEYDDPPELTPDEQAKALADMSLQTLITELKSNTYDIEVLKKAYALEASGKARKGAMDMYEGYLGDDNIPELKTGSEPETGDFSDLLGPFSPEEETESEEEAE